jgi:hypothetical protein
MLEKVSIEFNWILFCTSLNAQMGILLMLSAFASYFFRFSLRFCLVLQFCESKRNFKEKRGIYIYIYAFFKLSFKCQCASKLLILSMFLPKLSSNVNVLQMTKETIHKIIKNKRNKKKI